MAWLKGLLLPGNGEFLGDELNWIATLGEVLVSTDSWVGLILLFLGTSLLLETGLRGGKALSFCKSSFCGVILRMALISWWTPGLFILWLVGKVGDNKYSADRAGLSLLFGSGEKLVSIGPTLCNFRNLERIYKALFIELTT